MVKTNKAFRSHLAKEMRDKFNERNEQLKQIDGLPISEELKEQNRKAIMENFEKEMEEIKSRPGYKEARKTHVGEINVKLSLRKSMKEKEKLQNEYKKKISEIDTEIKEKKGIYESSQVEHRGEINYHEKWRENMHFISDDNKEKIINAAKKITVNIDMDTDGSKLIELRLGDKVYKILDLNLERHSDEKYRNFAFILDGKGRSIKEFLQGVDIYGMLWDDIDGWKNQKLKDYVKLKQGGGLHIAKKGEIISLLEELRKQANLNDLNESMALFMYLTGISGRYYLSMGKNKLLGNKSPRSILSCDGYCWGFDYCFDRYMPYNDGLFMISCK